MKNISLSLLFLLSLALFTGCDDSASPPPEPLDQSNLVSELESQFADADPEVKTMVDTVIKHFNEKKYTYAFQALDKVLFRQDLDKDSRILASRASLTISNILDEQAAKGDEAAKRMKKNIMLHK